MGISDSASGCCSTIDVALRIMGTRHLPALIVVGLEALLQLTTNKKTPKIRHLPALIVVGLEALLALLQILSRAHSQPFLFQRIGAARLKMVSGFEISMFLELTSLSSMIQTLEYT